MKKYFTSLVTLISSIFGSYWKGITLMICLSDDLLFVHTSTGFSKLAVYPEIVELHYNLISFFPVWILLIAFSCLITPELLILSWKNSKEGIHFLFLEKHSSRFAHSVCSQLASCTWHLLNAFLTDLTCLVAIVKGRWISSSTFSAFIEGDHMISVLHSVDMVNNV